MDIIGAIERNPKVAAGIIAGMIGINVVSLTVSGVYVHSVNKACKDDRAILEDIQKRLDQFNASLELLEEEDEEENNEGDPTEK